MSGVDEADRAVSEVAAQYARVADRFGARVDGVSDAAWDEPAPCEGWLARDVVRHLVEWFPPFLATGAGIEFAAGPSVDEDPVAAWQALDEQVRALLASPDAATRMFVHAQAGTHPLDQAIGMFFTGDLVIHTWDLARATGQDETIDPEMAVGMLAGMEPIDEMLRGSGHYGPRVRVAEDADVATRLIAFTGRQP